MNRDKRLARNYLNKILNENVFKYVGAGLGATLGALPAGASWLLNKNIYRQYIEDCKGDPECINEVKKKIRMSIIKHIIAGGLGAGLGGAVGYYIPKKIGDFFTYDEYARWNIPFEPGETEDDRRIKNYMVKYIKEIFISYTEDRGLYGTRNDFFNNSIVHFLSTISMKYKFIKNKINFNPAEIKSYDEFKKVSRQFGFEHECFNVALNLSNAYKNFLLKR